MTLFSSSNQTVRRASAVERVSLMALVQGEEGVAWAADRNGWDLQSEQAVCAWTGIGCDADGFVVSIDLSGSDLRAKTPSELGDIKSLRSINMADCDLYGPLPTSVAKLTNLETMDLSSNSIDGTLPTFSSSSSLKNLVLKNNRLRGPLPDPLPANLEVFEVSHNHLTSTIPWSYESLLSLSFFDVGSNELVGSLPYHIGNLPVLEAFLVPNNQLMGTIPFSFSRDDSKIQSLNFELNRLSGTVPAGLADIPPLKELFIDGNKLTGSVPRSLCRLNLNEDYFRGNENATGRDGCTSIACPVNTVSQDGVYPCQECKKQGWSPYLGHNKRCYYLDERMIMRIFWKQTDGPNWVGGEGWNVENAQKCQFEGVECNSAGKITRLTLSGMGLRGKIPEELGYLTQLEHLDISNNHLTGFLPSDLRWAPLLSLDVSGNKLEGFVPPMLCLTGDINGNGENGDFNCDVISCGKGAWSPIGRATHKTSRFVEGDGYECLPCPGGADYLGSKSCPALNVVAGKLGVKNTHGHTDKALVAGIIVAAILLCCLSGLVGAKISNYVSSRTSTDKMQGANGDEDESEELWFLDVPEEAVDDTGNYDFASGEKVRASSSSSKKKKKKKKKRQLQQEQQLQGVDDNDGQNELYMIDIPSVL